MVFKIAHICFCGNVDQAKECLQELGYQLLFSEKIRPMEITQEMSSKYNNHLLMSIWEYPGSISVELLEFESYSLREGMIIPILSGGTSNNSLAMKENESRILNGHKYYKADFLGCPAYVADQKQMDGFGFNSFMLTSTNLDNSIHFWSLFGFDCDVQTELYARLKFRCRLTSKYFFLYLEKCINEELAIEDIDSPGFHVVSLISNSASLEREKVRVAGVDVSALGQIVINGNKVDVFYARSPEGLVTEIISIC
ncbi:MAG: hypothetical protein CMN79_04305 [Spirochaetales bacterium]|jgi:hypothetical protein|nr:hypothetical protein [Spirochaetales bacterium]